MINDFSFWSDYRGMKEGSGRSEKKWLQCDNKIGLFKFPKDQSTTEHVSEHLSTKIGELIDIPTATVEIGKYNGRLGSMSFLIQHGLIESVQLISKVYCDFDPSFLRDTKLGYYYSIEMMENVFDRLLERKSGLSLSNLVRPEFYKMLVFDFLIGNSDRHQSNWGIRYIEEQSLFQFCPLYDNGSSLCSYVNEIQIDGYLGNDVNKVNALVDRQSKTIMQIRKDPKVKNTHAEVMAHLLKNNRKFILELCEKIIAKMTREKIREFLGFYSDDILSSKKKELILLFLRKKVDILSNMVLGDN